MALQLKGPGPAAMKAFAQKLRATGKLQDDLSRNMAEEALDLVREAMASEQDPDGNAWAELVLRQGQIGRDSGGMAQSLHVSDRGPSGFTLAFSKHYAGFFHGGTGLWGPSARRIRPKRAKALYFGVRGAKGTRGGKGRAAFFAASVAGSPPRRLFPSGSSLPSRWQTRLDAVAREVMRKALS